MNYFKYEVLNSKIIQIQVLRKGLAPIFRIFFLDILEVCVCQSEKLDFLFTIKPISIEICYEFYFSFWEFYNYLSNGNGFYRIHIWLKVAMGRSKKAVQNVFRMESDMTAD